MADDDPLRAYSDKPKGPLRVGGSYKALDVRSDPLRPPGPFVTSVVLCPACDHGIDPHGSDPGGVCGVGDAHGALCPCLWSPNDIAAALTSRTDFVAMITEADPATPP